MRQQKSPVPASSLWIYRPWLDLMVGCGAWSAPLLVLAYTFSLDQTRAWALALYGLALVFNYPHYMATIYRAYHTREDFHRYRIFTVHATLLVVATVVISHFWFSALPWIFTLYLSMSPWHYSGQNYGLFMMFARRAGAQPSKVEGRALYGAFVTSYLILLLNFHTGPSGDPLFVSLNLPAAWTSKAQAALGAAFVICSAFGLYRISRQTGWRKAIPFWTLFSTQCAWFLAPTVISSLLQVEIPLSRYSSGVLAVMHSAQYLWITSYYARRESAAATGQRWRPAAYFSVLVAGGIALFIPGPWLASVVFHFDFTRSFLLFTALVNIHHFILDGAIWKLRDGRIAALLLNSRDQVADKAREAGGSTMEALRWLAGPSVGAHRLRTGAACLLLAWGAADQMHYYFALQKESLPDLKLAAGMAPYDAPVELRVARQALDAGASADSEKAWQYAIRANPNDPAPRDAWLRYLLQQKNVEEAYQRTGEWLLLSPHDPALLINHGILAQQAGHVAEAEQSWRQALAADASTPEPELYLAEALEKEGRDGDAIPHYAEYLAKISHRTGEKTPPAATLVGVELKLANCEARQHHPETALRTYQMARSLASQTGERKLESFASVAEASLRSNLGQKAETLALYQRALALDAQLGDPHSEAVDWYDYAMALQSSGAPDRLVYASVLKAGALWETRGPEAEAAKSLQKELDRKMGSEAKAIRRNPEAAAQEALALNVKP